MPTVRYQIRNEYGLADPEVYRAAEKDDPEALLEGVAMAGLVGVLRQLGDLAEFAAEVFHDLHEEVMATSARGHGLLLRVQQLDAEFPLIEKAILSQIDHSHSAYNAGIDWHPNIRVEQNLVIQGDMPRFILDSYEECRGPPQLFMLDKFDVAGAGSCLTRYSNPSFFKTESASSEIMESELQREKKPRKIKKGSCWKNGETTNSFFMPILDYSQFLASEPVPEKFPSRLVKLKHRNLRVSDIRNRKSYMECLINELLEQNDPKISLSDSNINKSIDCASETREILTDSMIVSSPFREEVITQSPKELTTKFQNEKRNGKNFLEKASTLSDVSENLHPNSQNAKEEEMLMGLSNEVDIHDFDISSEENDMNAPPLQLAKHKNLLLDSGFISDVDHDSYTSDDIGSELENYVDALNTLETEVETDSESRGKSDPSFFNRQSQELNPNINGHLELQLQSSESDIMGSFDSPVYSRKEKDVMPNLRKSSYLVDLPNQLQLRTIFEETSSSEIKLNKGETGKLEIVGECMEIVPSACLSSNETCYQKQPNVTMPVLVSREIERTVMPNLRKSSNLVDLPYQLQLRTIIEETSSSEIKINQGETGNLEMASECMEIVPSACLSSNETCYQKQPNATVPVLVSREIERASECMEFEPSACLSSNESFYQKQLNAAMLVPIRRDACSSSSIADSALKPNGGLKEGQSLGAHSVEDFSGSKRSTPKANEHVESSFLPWKTNHVEVPSTFKPNAAMLVPFCKDAFSSSSIANSALKPNGDLKEVQLLGAHSVEDFSGSTISIPEVNEHVESSFLPWKTNHVGVPSSFKLNATMLVPISRDAFSSSSIADSALKPNWDLKEAQSLGAYSVEDFSGSMKSSPEFNEHVESSFLPWKTNHVGVPSTFKGHSDKLEEDNLIGHCEDKISATITDKDHMPSNSSKTDDIILQVKVSAECSRVSPLTLVDDEIGKSTQMQKPENKSDSIILKSHDTFIDMEVNMQSEYSAMKITSHYLDGYEDKKNLSSNVQFPAETHELFLLVSDSSGSHESTQNSENVGDDLAYIPDERGSYYERQNNPMIGHFLGYTENTMSDNTANTFQMPESPLKSSVVEVSIDYVKHSEIYSVKNLSPESSALSFEIVSSNLQPDNLTGEIRNIFVTQKEFVHPQSPVSSGDADILVCGMSTSPAISYDLEQFPVSVEPHEFSNLVKLEPLLSGSGKDSYATQLQLEEIELIETNEKNHVNDELEFTNGFTKLDLPHELLVGESKMDNKSLDGNVNFEDGIDGQVRMLESAKVSTFDLLLIENPRLEDDALYQLRPDDEEPAILRDSKLFFSENKSYFTPKQNEEQDMFLSSLSNQTSVLDLSNSFDTSFVDINVDDPHVKLYYSLKGDNISPSKNKKDSESISENAITEDDTDGDQISEDATLNQHLPEIENLDIASHDSASKNGIAEDGTDHQNLSLLESSYAYSFDAHIEEVSVSEDDSLNQHRPEIEKSTITSGLTSLKFESEFFVPFSKNGDQEEPISVVSSLQSLAQYSSNTTNAMLPDHNFDDIILEFYPGEESLICSSKNQQDFYLDASMQHFQSGAERPELQSEQAFVSEPSTILSHEKIKIELPDIHLDKDCSDENTLIHNSLKHEVLFTEPEPKAFINHGSNNELSMSPAKAHTREKIEPDLSVSFKDVSENPESSMASEGLASKSLVADFISPISITSMEEPLQVLPGESISRLSLLEGIEETPPLPPLPPIQWRMGKPPLGNLISDVYAAQPVTETNPFIFPLNMHMDQHAGPFMFHNDLEENFQLVSPSTDAHMTESSNLSELPQNKFDKIQQFEIQFPEIETVHSSGISSIISAKEDGNHAHGNFAREGEDLFIFEEKRPKLVKLLPGLELERSQETSFVETDAIPSFNPFVFMPTTRDAMYQYDYGNYGGYKGENLQHHSLLGSLPVAVQGFPPYNYHMFLREGNSSTMYDIMLPEMEGENQNGKHRPIRNRQRDPLIEAVAAHDKSTLRKVSELDRPLTKSKEDEKNYLLEQIKHKSLLLKPATSTKANILKAPSTNLKVAAILQRANAIRQACAGSDEDDDDNWN